MANLLIPGVELVNDGTNLYLVGVGLAELSDTATDPEITSIDPAPPLTVGQTGVQLIGLRFGT
jgi:hypothetical protein